jgi:hypothetical protein
MSVGLGGESVAEHRGRDAGHRLAEAFTAPSAAHGFAPDGAGIGEVEILHRDGVATVAARVAKQSGDRMPDLGIPPRGRPRQVEVDALGSPDRVAMLIEAS